jgi:uncharacterized protein (DUF2141 family)
VVLTGLQPGKGQVILNVFKDEERYTLQKPFKQIIVDKSSAKNGYMIVSVSLPEGAYGITLVDDINKNNTLDKNMPGTHAQGLGFSNCYPHNKNSPAFDDIKIIVKNENDIFDDTGPIEISVKYI